VIGSKLYFLKYKNDILKDSIGKSLCIYDLYFISVVFFPVSLAGSPQWLNYLAWPTHTPWFSPLQTPCVALSWLLRRLVPFWQLFFFLFSSLYFTAVEAADFWGFKGGVNHCLQHVALLPLWFMWPLTAGKKLPVVDSWDAIKRRNKPSFHRKCLNCRAKLKPL